MAELSADVAIVGGGPAGAAVACRLAGAGRRIVLLERAREPRHKVCGEFVSFEAAHHLATLGSIRDPLGHLGAVPIGQVRLVARATQATVSLPFPAWGLSRLRLDAWLLHEAERAGADVRRGWTVQGIAADGTGGMRLATTGGPLAARRVVLATGKHELRGHQRPGSRDALVGLKLHVRLSPSQGRALVRHVELVLFEGGYAGLQQVEGGIANLCLLVTKERFAWSGCDWRRLLLEVPHLKERLVDAAPCWPRPLAICRIPHGYLHRAKSEDDVTPVYRVGDQLAVIPSFTGDGMAMALHTASLAADAILAGRSAASFHAEAVRLLERPVRLASLVSRAGAVLRLQEPIVRACRLAPALVRGIARHTRIPGAIPEVRSAAGARAG
ncbi:NAD(P)/FAD-dependent oxidoreductase [Benzoatithermus flavus]|uniref:FAD-dependent monooxygenase n=1 Tax=Benzoatithermus flavus TaxID=3108223 RepID=A0ABU8XWS9_9PROT